jgi:hypothetical protein
MCHHLTTWTPHRFQQRGYTGRRRRPNTFAIKTKKYRQCRKHLHCQTSHRAANRREASLCSSRRAATSPNQNQFRASPRRTITK